MGIYNYKGVNNMTKYQFEKEIKDRIEADTGEKIDINDVKKIIETSENIIMELIATNESVKFSWGIIGGMVKEPKKITGSAQATAPDPYFYSFAKSGTPFCLFGRNAKFCTLIPAHEWFMNPENQYGKAWDKYKKEMDEDLGGERFKHFLGLYGIKRDERKEKREAQKKEYEEFKKNKEKDANYIQPTEPFTFEEMKKLPVWAEGSLRGI